MPADPFSMLELDHRHVAQLLDELGDSKPGPERERAVKDLEESLAAHMKFEELKVYPLVVTEIDADAAKEAETEHGLARDGLAKVVELVAEPGFGAAIESLKAGVTHHVEEEEGEMFPKLRAGTPDQVQDELATQMLAAKKAAGLPVVPREATKEQLVTLAGQLEIDGRSQMSKDELVDVINRKG